MRITTLIIRLMLVLLIVVPASSGQSSGSKNSGSSSSGGDSASSGPGGLGFAIETEMLTYKSVEANSEAVACDIARQLFKGELGPPTATAPCTITSGTNAGTGVVIVTSSSTIFSDFQLWRADMTSMNALQRRASRFCSADASRANAGQSRGLPSIADLTPAGQILPMAQSVVGMFATNESVTSVTGTVQDQALMNAVGRQLKALNISVLIPDLYNPFALGGADFSNSPFLSNLGKLIDTRNCLQARLDSKPKEQMPEAAEIGSTIVAIDLYIDFVTGNASSSSGPGTPAPGRAPGSPAASNSNSAEPGTHFAAALNGDGMARAIGMRLDGTMAPNSIWQHVLWIKALESGGSVMKQGNIFGTKVRFSGGAVNTYALFNINGNLDCSGNVYDFEGSVAAKDFSRVFHEQIKDPTSRLASVRGSCGSSK